MLYHLEERGIEHAVIPWCEAHGVAVVGYSPFGHGRFPGAEHRRRRVLAEIAAAPRRDAAPGGARLPRPRGRRCSPSPRPPTPAIRCENAAAGDLHLDAAEIAAIDAAFPLGRPRGLAMI